MFLSTQSELAWLTEEIVEAGAIEEIEVEARAVAAVAVQATSLPLHPPVVVMVEEEVPEVAPPMSLEDVEAEVAEANFAAAEVNPVAEEVAAGVVEEVSISPLPILICKLTQRFPFEPR